MQRSGGTRRIIGVVALIGLMLAVDIASVPKGQLSTSHTSEVLSEVEVRERRTTLSDGRTTSESEAASGLFHRSVGILAADVEPDSLVLAADGAPAAAGLSNRGGDAVALIDFPWRDHLDGWSITFLPARGNVRGLTLTEEDRIEVHVRDEDTVAELARVLAHELGHAVDLSLMDTPQRDAWRSHRGIAAERPWWPGDGLTDFGTGAGDFAECFASWQVGSTSLSRVAGPCSEADQAFLADLVRTAASADR